jgi:hypothetical protein
MELHLDATVLQMHISPFLSIHQYSTRQKSSWMDESRINQIKSNQIKSIPCKQASKQASITCSNNKESFGQATTCHYTDSM